MDNRLTNLQGFNDCKLVIIPTMKFGIAKLPKTFYKNKKKAYTPKKKKQTRKQVQLRIEK